jgi:hypothetical protein
VWGLRIFLPGIRITLWLAATFLVIAGLLAARSLGLRRPKVLGGDEDEGRPVHADAPGGGTAADRGPAGGGRTSARRDRDAAVPARARRADLEQGTNR